MNKTYKIILIIMLIILLPFILVSAGRKKPTKITYPKKIEELIMPSGFDNSYAIAVKEKKAVLFIKPVLRIISFKISEGFLNLIKDPQFKMDEALKSEISKTGRFTLLGNEADIKAILEEQKKLGDDAFNKDSTQIEMGNLRIAGYTLTGEITHAYPNVKQVGGYFLLKVSVGASITVTNAMTGEIEFTHNISSENEEKLFVSAEGMIIQGPRNLTSQPLNSINASGSDIDLSPQYYKALTNSIKKIMLYMEEKYPIMGEVIGVKKDIVTTSVSEKHGIKAGDFLFVVRAGEPLTDAAGNILGLSKDMIGALEILSVEKNMCHAKIIKLKDTKTSPEKRDIVISLPSGIK